MFDIVMFTETWYKEENDFFLLSGYTHFVQTHDYGHGGGESLLAAQKGYSNVPQFCSLTKDHETLCVKKESHI